MEFDKVAVIGEREAVLGFKLVGIPDVFITSAEEGAAKLAEIMDQGYSLIIATEQIRQKLSQPQLRSVETALKPIVIFISVPGKQGETVEALAKRVLGVNIAAQGRN
ncbi:MAG: V-type ATP synthase subunit F [Candidatus Micrarchaeaceae archaeon]